MYMYLIRSQAIGAVAIGLGIWVLVEEPDVLELSSLRELTVMDQSYLLTSVYLVITAGAAILVFGIVGMVATNAQSACCLGFVSIRTGVLNGGDHFNIILISTGSVLSALCKDIGKYSKF